MKKCRSAKGFTLAETLMTVLILLMVSAVVAAGIPAAASAYQKVVDGSNAQLLLSTTVSALRDELVTASNLTADSTEQSVTYRTAGGVTCKLIPAPADSGDGIRLQNYLDTDDVYTRQLVSRKAASDRLYTSWESIAFADGVVTVTGLTVKKVGGDGTALASLSTLKIRVLMQS